MGEIIYTDNSLLKIKDILHLYNDVGWSEYCRDIKKLRRALNNSLAVLTAWDKDRLVGLIRVVGDGETIIYIQDILVLKEYQRQGIGSKLINRVINKYEKVRQKVLLTDNTEKTGSFYRKNGFKSAEEYNLVSFLKTT